MELLVGVLAALLWGACLVVWPTITLIATVSVIGVYALSEWE